MTLVPADRVLRQAARISFKHLRLIALIASTSNLHRAGEAMHITQSAATKMLQGVEATLGVRIFDRTARALVPTEIGKFIIEYANKTLAEGSRFLLSLQGLNEGGYGELAIGAITSTGAELLPTAIAELKARRPFVRIEIVAGTSDNLLDKLEQGSLDLVVGRYSNFRQQALFSRETLGMDRVSVYAAAGHELSLRPTLTAADLLKYAWVLQASPSPSREIIDEYFSKADLSPPRNLVETESTFMALQLVRRASMLSVLSDEVMATEIMSGDFVRLPIALADPREPYGIIRRRDATFSQTATEFADILRETARSIAQDGLELRAKALVATGPKPKDRSSPRSKSATGIST